MPTLKDIVKQHLKNTDSLKGTANVDNLDNLFSPSPRVKNHNNIRVREGGQKVCNVSNVRAEISSSDPARRLAELLNHRKFQYFDQMIRPEWSVLKTNRVQSRSPNIQGYPAAERTAGLTGGLSGSEALIILDYKSAEPALIAALTECAHHFVHGLPIHLQRHHSRFLRNA